MLELGLKHRSEISAINSRADGEKTLARADATETFLSHRVPVETSQPTEYRPEEKPALLHPCSCELSVFVSVMCHSAFSSWWL